MFKLKTVGAVTLASLLLLSGCSSNNPEDEIEPVNNTLPYDSRTVSTSYKSIPPREGVRGVCSRECRQKG